MNRKLSFLAVSSNINVVHGIMEPLGVTYLDSDMLWIEARMVQMEGEIYGHTWKIREEIPEPQ